ncbi:hypothetical protein LWI29_017216 [Acer saccharum]|uniref:Small ribosomal subunit protein uS2c n=1 Tax=Acer saccharum TaxID=4024 RepID=A0AA39RLX3_ACESA|nr:hypothetical protein LWI29_017216 [Acer saccharum]KAK1572388.1 hypothetical protein Q3G72_031953 [Acer saccharum]
MAHLLHTTFLPSSSSAVLPRPHSRTFRVSSGRVRVDAKLHDISMPTLSCSTMGDGKIVPWVVKSENHNLTKAAAVTASSSSTETDSTTAVKRMGRRYWNINLQEMMEAGIHFGHGTRKWNPRMAPFISAKHKGIHIINLIKTARFLSEACDLVFDAASRGKQFLIVGTNSKAADLVARAATAARCHYVNKKWLGGMLTNWSTTETRLHKLRDLRVDQKNGRFERIPKQNAAILKRQLSRLQTYLGGIKYMTRVPDIVIIVDQQEEYTALRECITLGIPTICLIDTNCDPDLADISIPGNDDAIASIRLVLNKLVHAITEGRASTS